MKVYIVTYYNYFCNDSDTQIIGVYINKESAIQAVARFGKQKYAEAQERFPNRVFIIKKECSDIFRFNDKYGNLYSIESDEYEVEK